MHARMFVRTHKTHTHTHTHTHAHKTHTHTHTHTQNTHRCALFQPGARDEAPGGSSWGKSWVTL